MGFALRKYGPNGQDLQSKNMTESLWDSHGQNGQEFHLKKCGVCRRSYGPNGQDLQCKNMTESLWDSHGQNGQGFPSEKVWGLA